MTQNGTICLLATLVAAGCAASQPAMTPAANARPSSEASQSVNATPQEEPSAVECTLRCELPRVVRRAAAEPDYTQRETDNATAVLSSMKTDLASCYRKQLRVNPRAQGAITVEIEVGEDGHVRKVDTTGASVLGRQTMACISHRIEKGVFEPPHGGGNIYVEVPFTLEVVSPDQT